MNCPICQKDMLELPVLKSKDVMWCVNKTADNAHILSSSPGNHWSLTFDKYTVLRASDNGISVFDNTAQDKSQTFIQGPIPLDANLISVVRNYLLLK